MSGRIVLFAATAAILTGCTTEPFGCESDEQCQVDTAAGSCEANGYCSFPDPDCETGRRYSNLAGGGLAGLCVNAAAQTTGPGSSSGEVPTTVEPASEVTTAPTTEGSSSSSTSTSLDTSTTAPESTDTGSSSGSSTTGGFDLDDGLVVHVAFDDPPTDEGVISIPPGLLPVSCDNPTGRCPTLVPGVVGLAGDFDGVNDVLVVEDDVRLRLQDALSLCLWTRRTGLLATDHGALAGKAFGGGGANSYELYFLNPTGDRELYDAYFSTDTPAASAVLSALPNEAWAHLCGVWDGATWELYVDGVSTGSAPLEAAPSYDEHPFLVGADTEADVVTHFFPGLIDEVRLYDRALSPDDVMSLATEG